MMDRPNDNTGNEPLAKNEEYLWDGSGAPDPEVQNLEALLRTFRHAGLAPIFPANIPQQRWGFSLRRVRLFSALATATASLLLIGGVIFLKYGRKPLPVMVAGW